MYLTKTDKVTLVGLYIAKFDKKALDALGFTGMWNAFNILGYSLGASPASIKNYRDEFDRLFPDNPRKGWNRPLKKLNLMRRGLRLFQMDILSKKKRSDLMRRVKSKGNKSTEIKTIGIFKTFGIKGWKRGYKIIGHPDFVFVKQRLAIFVDGCFWHGCIKHCRIPVDNHEY